MSSSPGTILVTAAGDVAARITEAMGDDPVLAPVERVSGLEALAAALPNASCALVLVDIAEDPQDILADLSPIVDAHPDKRFVVVSQTFDRDLLFLAMQAGARHFLPIDWIGPEVRLICRDLVDQVRGGAAGSGDIVTVLSASGGCGATTLSIALAADLARLRGARTVLIDLDTRLGGAANHLGLEGEYGIANVLERGPGLDPELLASTAVSASDIDVLLSPATVDFEEPAPLDFSRLEEVARVLRTAYGATVIDAPRVGADVAAELAGLSTAALLVTELNVSDLRSARAILRSLRARDAGQRVRIVASRVRKGGGVTIADAVETLELEENPLVVPEDHAGAIRALNAGVPVHNAAPKSPLARALGKIAQLLTPSAEGAGDSGASKRKRMKAA